MSNISVFPTTTTATTISKTDATELARRLYADDANAFAAVSSAAAREAFCKRCASLAISALVHGEDSRLRRLRTKAIELPEYRKTKSGEIVGNLGKLLQAYGEASGIGFMLREQIKIAGRDPAKVEMWDLSLIEGSPSFAALVAPPKPREKDRSSSTTAPTTKPEPETKPETKPEPKPEPAPHWSTFIGPVNKDADSAMAESSANAAQDVINAAAAAAAEELAQNAVLAHERLRGSGRSTREKIMEFCELATQLGIKLTASQLKTLDALEAKAAALAA